jgi:hypothetical protein
MRQYIGQPCVAQVVMGQQRSPHSQGDFFRRWTVQRRRPAGIRPFQRRGRRQLGSSQRLGAFGGRRSISVHKRPSGGGDNTDWASGARPNMHICFIPARTCARRWPTGETIANSGGVHRITFRLFRLWAIGHGVDSAVAPVGAHAPLTGWRPPATSSKARLASPPQSMRLSY